MLTSHNVNVARHVNPRGLIHRPKPLSADQSWELLQSKALPTRGDYLDITRDVKRMERLGGEMVKNCAGLPLAIVILGGVLVTKPTLIEWEKVYNDSQLSLKKGKGLGENQQEELLLVRSYIDLPPQLKPCFLYLSKFSEDRWIDAETLYQLLIAEGIILSSDKREGETMMQVAESYMGELVLRSMVQVRYNDLELSLTKFKSFSLHDLMRDLSLSEAKVEGFFEAIDLREGSNFHHNSSEDTVFAYTRQLIVYYDDKDRSENSNSYFDKKSSQQYRSFLLMNLIRCRSLPPVLRLHFANFRLLRVFAFEKAHLDRQSVSGTLFRSNLGRAVGSLVHLRYLSARNSNLMIFPWIQKLVLLQTLKLDAEYYNCIPQHIPPLSNNILGKLAHLRHLYLPKWAFYKRSLKLRFDGLSKLETLENFNTDWCEVMDLLKLTSLQRLRIQVSGRNDDVEEVMKYIAATALPSSSCLLYLALSISSSDLILSSSSYFLRVLDHNYNLRELEITGKLPELAKLFQQQQLNNTHAQITKLCLSGSYLEEDPMPVLEKIPTLKDLCLLNDAYWGKEMVCSATGFPKLTRLELLDLRKLVKWRVEEGSMTNLSYLLISQCCELDELPEGMRFLNSLRALFLHSMLPEFSHRVRVVNDKQGSDFYKVAHIPLLRIYD